MKKYVAYYRVSTKQQGHSGLGLAAQKQVVENFISPEKIYKEFTEVESGKKDNRIELQKAIDICKKENCILIIAKLDRLSRNISFITALMDSKINFVCADMPDATNFTIHIFAALAEQERKMISERTKKGLEQAKIKGKKLGNPQNLDKKAIEKGKNVRIENSINNINNKKAFLVIESKYGKLKLQQIADLLNENGFKTSNNKAFTPTQVKRIYEKYNKVA